jgi:hypothetical protein
MLQLAFRKDTTLFYETYSFSYVSGNNQTTRKKAILKNIETGLNQMKGVKAGTRKARPVSELLREMADDKG